jgi:glycosyltransferase involved in cell wall biosynthesis
MKGSDTKVLYGITKSNFGGAQRYVYELARGSKDRGFDTAVLLGGQGVLKDKLESRGIRTLTLPALDRDISLYNDIKEFFSIISILKKEKPDVFHTNSSKMGGLGALAGKIARVPKIIFTAHGFAFNESNRSLLQKAILKCIYWMIILLSDHTICVSESVKNRLETWPYIKNKLVVIHNGIMPFDLVSREDARKELGIKPNTFVVGTIAELHRVKGLDILLRAWLDYTQEHKAMLVIIGDGSEGENLNLLSKKLGIENSVYFAGFVDNARKYLLAFDVFVLASRSEGFPYALLEAGFASLPVVATSVGGVPEIIKEGETGLLVEPGYPEELAHILIGLSKDEQLRKTLGENVHTFTEKEFSLAQMFDHTFMVY